MGNYLGGIKVMKCKETKNNIVVFDTDFLITNTKSITDIIKKISTKYVCYVPQICIDEFCAKKYNDALEKIRKFKNDLKSYEKLGISFGMSESECEKMIKEETSVTLKKMFSNNIICFHDYPLIKIVNRAYAKKPPFEESDKGLKDTLILLTCIAACSKFSKTIYCFATFLNAIIFIFIH